MKRARVLSCRNVRERTGADVVAFLELPGQARSLLSILRKRGTTSWKVVTLTPHAEVALEELGETYARAEDYYEPADIDQRGLLDFDVTGDLTNQIDDFLSERWGPLVDGVRPAGCSWYRLKLLITTVSVRAMIMRRILDAEKPNLILFFDTQSESIGPQLFYYRESAWSRVVPAAARSAGITVEPIGGGTNPAVLNVPPVLARRGGATQIRGMVRRFTGRPILLLGLRGLGRVRGLGQRLRYSAPQGRLAHRSPVLALSQAYSLKPVLDQVMGAEDLDLLHWDLSRAQPPRYASGQGVPRGRLPAGGAVLRRRARSAWKEWSGRHSFRGQLVFSGVDCFPILESRLKYFFEKSIPAVVSIFAEAAEVMASEQPVAVVAATMESGELQAVSAAARARGVPVVVYRHGASGGHVMMESWPHSNEVWDRIELRPTDYLLCFGEGDVRYFNGLSTTDVSVVPIGSAALDALRAQARSQSTRPEAHRRLGLDPTKPTVMYVPTTMDGNIRTAPFRSRTPSHQFRLEESIVDVFQEFPDFQFVVKLPFSRFYPTSPVVQVVKQMDRKNVIVSIEPFSSVMGAADLFVTDYPSTTFLEMLTTDRAILVCGHELSWPWAPGVWHPSVLDIWKERVAYADGMEEFLDLLRTYLAERRFGPVHSQDSLLKLFGTHLDDGESSKRAYAFLRSLATTPATGADQAGTRLGRVLP